MLPAEALGVRPESTEPLSTRTVLYLGMATPARHAGQTCIYCLGDSKSARGAAHAFPEAVFPAGPTLPAGGVCDGCDQYAGRKLEATLISYPLVALALQLMRLPGKRGTVRQRIGVYELSTDDRGGVTFPIEPPEFGMDADGVSTAKIAIHPQIDPKFDMDRFRRALYHIAFNLAAANLDLAHALRPEYDPIRKYVKAPDKGERWPFVEVTQQLTNFVPGVGAHRLEFPGAELVKLRIFNTEYFVDLINSGRLLTVQFENNDGRAKLIGPDWTIPRPRQDPGRLYRATIR